MMIEHCQLMSIIIPHNFIKITMFLFRSKNQQFTRLYMAETINLIGDSFTWIGLALLTFQFVGKNSGIVLSTALTLRVIVFVLLAPLAGVIADYFDRKRLMVITHLSRMLIVCLLPFITQIWQIYIIILLLNIFNTFFTPTYRATIPLLTGKEDYQQAIALSNATAQILDILGPGLAGTIATFIGIKSVFFLDGLTFLIAAILIMTLPGKLNVNPPEKSLKTIKQTGNNLYKGNLPLWLDPFMRYALMMELVIAITGAQILVNTVGYIQGKLQLGNVEYGWVMGAFGIGAILTSITLIKVSKKLDRISLISGGALMISLALFPANLVNLGGLFPLWILAGMGQSLVELNSQILIADRVSLEVQGRVYGAHFAWSHLWWVGSYPLAGWLGNDFTENSFFYGSIMGLILTIMIYFTLHPRQPSYQDQGYWHEHEHIHQETHLHEHSVPILPLESHNHLHFHQTSHPSPY